MQSAQKNSKKIKRVSPGGSFYGIKWYKIETFQYSSQESYSKHTFFQKRGMGVVFAMKVRVAVTKM